MCKMKKYETNSNLSGWSKFTMNKKLIISLALTFLLTSLATATTRNVPGDYANIQAAITAAVSGDDVNVANGTYAGNIDFNGKAITVHSANGPANCIINGSAVNRAFYFHTNEPNSSVVRGFTITNGYSYYGGAIECDTASPTIDNCVINNNAASYGGAIDCFYGSPVIKNCIISNNTSTYDGSAFECGTSSSPQITNCLIISNTAGGVGSIDCYSTNSSDSSSPQILNCTIANNVGNQTRGGVYAWSLSHPTIRNSILWNNTDDIFGTAVTSSYSCIKNNDSGTGNIHIDPLFRTGSLGNYYLSQIAAGQPSPNSPCLNGSIDAVTAIYNPWTSYTTRTDYVPDDPNTTVDMGYHYPTAGTFKQYRLITSVVGAPSGHGTITPNYASPGQLINSYERVNLTATPDTDYEVDMWSGTLNTRPTDVNNNVVTVDANKTVTVKFRSKIMYQLTTSVPLAHGTLTPVSGLQRKDTDVNLVAFPDLGYKVKKWSNNTDNPSSTLRKNSVTMTGPQDVNVVFEPNISFQLRTQVDNGSDGQPHGTISPRGGNYLLGTPVTLTANPETTNYKVEYWQNTDNDSCSTPINKITMLSNTTVHVKFKLKPTYTLTVNATPSSLGTATVSPLTGPYYDGTIVTITAHPNTGYMVESWTGTNNDSSTSLTNTVTMTSNKTVSLQFKLLRQSKLIVVKTGDANGIQNAIDLANNGDIVQIPPGTYVATGFKVKNKSITILGDPKNPENVVIDGTNENVSFREPLGFQFTGSGNCVLNGVTIANILIHHGIVRNNKTPDESKPSYGPDSAQAIYIEGGNHQILNCIMRNVVVISGDGGNGVDGNSTIHQGSYGGDGGSTVGGGIVVFGGSPAFKNCIIEDCCAVGGNGGNGGNGYSYSSDTEPNNGDAGQGGMAGFAFGGGISVIDVNALPSYIYTLFDINSTSTTRISIPIPPREWYGVASSTLPRPTFENCTIRNCHAKGGHGGNGGNAGWHFPDPCGYGGLTTVVKAGQGDIVSNNSARGGGVFIGKNCNAQFTNCTISDSATEGSISGVGGLSFWNVQQQPKKNYHLPTFGAGVFCDGNSIVKFSNCTLQGNNTISTNAGETIPSDDNDFSGGAGLGLWFVKSAQVNGCSFALNSAPIGGGIYGFWTNLNVTDSNIANNNSYAGGGVYALNSVVEIKQSIIKGNNAGSQSGSNVNIGYPLFGSGGGVYALASMIDINDTTITENFAQASGGGICIDGWPTPEPHRPLIKNCLITGNTAVESGGGITSIYFADPQIQNCTIANNIVSEPNGNGGGLFCSYESDTIVKDSILWDNSGMDGSQIALSDGGLFTDMPANLTITYSDIDLRNKLGFNLSTSEPSGGSGATLVNQQIINDEINSSGSAKVIVSLVEPSEAKTTNWSSTASVSALQGKIAEQQAIVLSSLGAGEFTLRHKLANVAAFSGSVTAAGLNKLLTNSAVAHIEPVRTFYPELAQGIPLMNALDSRPTFNGQGMSVAIVDTGVDYTHPRLGGGGFPNSKVIGGYDFGDNDADPMPSNVSQETGHGTCCAGIVAGSLGTVGDYIGGVSYNAKIYALKATQNTDPLQGLSDDDIVAAWDWCISHMNDNPAYPIKVISNSFGDGKYSSSAVAEANNPAMAAVAKRAVEAGITVLASAGNDGFTDSLSAPAAFSSVISVGAVYDAAFISSACKVQTQPDKVACYSNTADILTILAPSENAYTTDIVGTAGFAAGDYCPSFNGTSAACPYAAGAVAALQSAAKQLLGEYLTPSQVKTILTMSGTPVTDTKVAITKPRVNLGDAIVMISSSASVYTERYCTITGLVKDVNGIWEVASGSNNISDDPNFAVGYFGSYYLSQIQAGQNINSPCVDAGQGSAISNGMYKYTTRTDHVIDTNVVDMGYHYLLTTDLLGDFNFDGAVNLEDLAILALYWLNNNCSSTSWCYGTDLTGNGTVNFADFALFAENYGRHETVPPIPNPMTWAEAPYPAGEHEVTMKASKALDLSSGTEVQYYFKCVSGSGGHDQDWSPNPLYTDTGLNAGTRYGYQAKARDIYNNETGWSIIGYATPSLSVSDTTPPTPDPMTWATKPYGVSTSSIHMIATTASDTSGVEYYFANVTNPAHDSGWKNDPNYLDTGLLANTKYTYKVKARDKSPNQNVTAYSITADANTQGATPPVVDTNAPTPYPSWSVSPRYTTSNGIYYYLTMTATTATDATPPVYYKFQCVSSGGTSSDWQLDPTWSIGPFIAQSYAVYVIYTRDSVVPTPNVAGPSSKVDTNGAVVP